MPEISEYCIKVQSSFELAMPAVSVPISVDVVDGKIKLFSLEDGGSTINQSFRMAKAGEQIDVGPYDRLEIVDSFFFNGACYHLFKVGRF